jgi:hypothetical protein
MPSGSGEAVGSDARVSQGKGDPKGDARTLSVVLCHAVSRSRAGRLYERLAVARVQLCRADHMGVGKFTPKFTIHHHVILP